MSYSQPVLGALLALAALPGDGSSKGLVEVAGWLDWPSAITDSYFAPWAALGALQRDAESGRYRRALAFHECRRSSGEHSRRHCLGSVSDGGRSQAQAKAAGCYSDPTKQERRNVGAFRGKAAVSLCFGGPFFRRPLQDAACWAAMTSVILSAGRYATSRIRCGWPNATGFTPATGCSATPACTWQQSLIFPQKPATAASCTSGWPSLCVTA